MHNCSVVQRIEESLVRFRGIILCDATVGVPCAIRIAGCMVFAAFASEEWLVPPFSGECTLHLTAYWQAPLPLFPAACARRGRTGPDQVRASRGAGVRHTCVGTSTLLAGRGRGEKKRPACVRDLGLCGLH